MKLAYFSGCKIPFYMKDYDLSFRAVMNHFKVDLVDLEFNCCGYPARSDDFTISIFSSIKNLAMAEEEGFDVITPCKCCFGQFKHAIHWYESDPNIKKRIDHLLKVDDLAWSGQTKVSHALSFLHDEIGLEAIGNQIKAPLPPQNIAVQYGCHALRPFSITGFDNPFFPQIFEAVLSLTGVNSIDWSKRTECCGNPILETQEKLSLKIVQNKLNAAKEEGADYICTACTHCQIQYELAGSDSSLNDQALTTILFTQILGTALGIPEHQLAESGHLPGNLLKARAGKPV